MDIPRLKEREEALALYEASRAAHAALDEASDHPNAEVEAKFAPRYVALENKQIAERRAMHNRHMAEDAALDAEKSVALGIGDLQAKATAAQKAWEDYPLDIEITEDDDGNEVALRCAKSGVVILNDDETVEDEHTNEVFLRVALGLPARPQEDDDKKEEAA